MSDLITIPRSEWKAIASFINSADIIGMDEACGLLDISRKTLQNKISAGIITPYMRAVNGAPLFKKSQLIKNK